jgi:hypothetical protein
MALPVTITGISTAVAPVGPFKVPATLFQIVTGLGTGASFGNNVQYARGQSFTTSGSGGSVASVVFYVAKSGTLTDGLQVNLYATDGAGTVTGSVLATSVTVAASAINTTATRTEFAFAASFALTPSTQYAAILTRTGSQDGSNFYLVYGAGTDVNATEKGNLFNGSTWSSATGDYNFLVTGASPDAYYFFGRDGTTATTLQAYKATAPDTSWSSIANLAGTAFTTALTTAINQLSAFQVGNVIHIAIGASNGNAPPSPAYFYATFDAATDTFVLKENIIINQNSVGQTGANQYGVSLVVRSTGEVVAFFNGTQTKTSGTNYARVYYSRRTAVNTWSAAVEVDAAAAADRTFPSAILGASDAVHFLSALPASTSLYQRTLSSANVLQTESVTTIGSSLVASPYGLSYLRSATTKIVAGEYSNGDIAIRFDSGNTPTLARATILANLGALRLSNDGTDVWALYRNATDSDLYVKKSTDDGGTWGTATNVFTGTVGATDPVLSIYGDIYTRGTAVVIPYIVNDNGTLKYNEYTVRTTGPVDHPLTAAGGSYALTGASTTSVLLKRRIDATTGAAYALTGASTTNLLHKARIDATVGGTYALTGAATTSLLHKVRQNALGGSYALTGTDAAITKAAGLVNKTLPAAGSSYALSGTDAAIIKRTFKTLAAVGGSYALAGTATGVLHAWRPVAGSGSYALTGTAATVTKFANKSLIAGSSSYSLTGAATTNLRHGWKVVATTPASYSLAGSAATFVIHRDLLSAAPGTYALTGTAVAFSIRSDKFVSAATGNYILIGTAATMRRTYKSAALAGSYAVTGTAASPRYGRQVAATVGSYSLTGSTASVLHGWKPAALSGSYALTGAPATLQHVWNIAAIAGSYALAGTAASVLHRDRLTATGGSYALIGTAALVRYGYKVPAGASSYALTGAAVAFPRKRVLTADPLIGRYTLTGKPALVLYRWTVRATGGAYAYSGTPAVVRRVRTITAAPGAYALTGSSAIINLIGLHSVLAEPGSYAITGNVARIFTGEWTISDRTVQALAEVRSAAATAEIRSVKAIAETRMVKVATESRHVLAIEEFRTIQARGESHGVSQMERQGSRRSAGLQHRLVATADKP